MSLEIQVNGRSYQVQPLEHETDKVLSSILWFIIKQNPENDIDFQEAEKWSIVWYYMHYFNCQYPKEVEDKVTEMSKYLYT